jgi:hypothetical protein
MRTVCSAAGTPLSDTDNAVTENDFASYIAAFNRGDHGAFSAYYADDVLLELGARRLRGREAIVSFYRDLQGRIKETLVPGQVVIGESGIAAELDTRFEAMVDWPGFMVQPIRAGEVIRLVSFVMYKVRSNAFTHIRAARFAAPEVVTAP